MAENGKQPRADPPSLSSVLRSPSSVILAVAPGLLSQSETRDDGLIPLEVSIANVSQQRRPVAHHLEQTAPGGMILGMRSEMLGQIVDSPRQQRDLYFRRSCVSVMDFEIPDNTPFILFS
jgi:hypothetical protein